MPLSVIYDLATGRQKRLRVGSASLAVENPATEGFVELAALNREPNPDLFVWNPTTRTYVDAPTSPSYPVSRTRITREEFVDKWTDAELLKLHELRLAGTIAQRARLELIRERLTSRDYVRLDHAKVIAAVTWMVGQLANAGTIAPDDAPTRQARVAAILLPLTVAETQ